MILRRAALALAVAVAAAGCAAPAGPGPSNADLVAAVTAAETAFAQTMVDRDHTAFLRFLSAEAVFTNGGRPLVGRDAVGRHWARFYEGPTPPFTWKPDVVVVAASGRLAHSQGPVSNPAGKVTARFYSTWRLEDDRRWRVLFDDGYPVCDCPPK